MPIKMNISNINVDFPKAAAVKGLFSANHILVIFFQSMLYLFRQIYLPCEKSHVSIHINMQ